MGSCNQGQAVVVVEGLADILTKSITSSTGRDSPSAAVIRVGPQKVTHGTFMRYLLNTVKSSDVIESVDAGRKTTVETEDLVVDQGSQGKVVEEVGEVFPHVGVAILAQALVVESINLCDLARLVVATENGNTLGVSDLERDKQSHCLDRVVTTIDIVTYSTCQYALKLHFFHDILVFRKYEGLPYP